MGRWSRSLAPLFVRFAGVRDGDSVLDIGSGTGALTAAVAKTAPSSRVVGVGAAAADLALAQSRPLFRRGDLAALWREQGLRDVVEEGLTIETRFARFDDFWTPFLEKQGPAGAYAALLSAEDREALRLRLRRRLLGGGPDRAIVMHARAWVVRGTIP
jgi:SAM-dependent methyltransferase